jgi:four helix bundle protein
MQDQKAATFPHEKLDVYHAFLDFAGVAEGVVIGAERYAVSDQLERATESIGANLIRGNSQWSPAVRVTSFDVALASALECAACLDVCRVKELADDERIAKGKKCLYRIVGMLLGLVRHASNSVREDDTPYGNPVFSHEHLDAYRVGLDFIQWAGSLEKRGVFRTQQAKKLDAGSTSVVLNIAEGNGKFGQLDQVKFIGIAHAAALQCVLHLDLAVARGRINERDILSGKAMLSRICAMLMGWRRRLVGANADQQTDLPVNTEADSETEKS